MSAWPYPKLFAHRGGGTLAPENTLAAIRFGHSLGYRACEFDVKLSSDGVAMLLHDATLERTTSGKGDAGGRTWAELANVDAGAWHSDVYRGETIPRFDAVATELLAKKAMVNVEIKPSPGRDKETGAHVAAMCAGLFASAPVAPLLSSFSCVALSEAQVMAPELPRGWLTDRVEPGDWDRLEALEAVSLHTSHKNLVRADVERAHKLGLRVMIYTVNDIARAEELFSWGVDGLFTDNLRVFAERFPKYL